MPWFKVDDSLYSHPKFRQVGMAARGLWLTAATWSANHLTDGFVPDHMIDWLGGTRSQRQKLIKAGLWDEVPGGCQFHDWSDWQPTREQVSDRRAEWARRKKKSRETTSKVPHFHPQSSSENLENLESPQVSEGGHAVVPPSRPVPTRPEGSTTTTSVTADAVTQTETAPVDTDPQGAFWPAPANPAAEAAEAKRAAQEASRRAAADREKRLADEFEAWWRVWPRKVGKADARKSYLRARRSATAEKLRDSANVQVQAWADAAKDIEFIPHAATWLNQERFNDEVSRPNFRKVTDPASPMFGFSLAPTGSGNEWQPE